MKKFLIGVILAVCVASCGEVATNPQQDAMNRARESSRNADIYIPRNGLELSNYNRRQEVADDPTTILWCTMFPFGDTGPITFAVVGKLTSGNKRPYPTEQVRGSDYNYYPELAGPDGMYGSSGEYRYGFGPDNVYHDVYGLQTYCTTQPMVYRRQPSGMTVAVVDGRLAQASQRAREVLQGGLTDGVVSQEALTQADRILSEALTQPAQ